MVHYSLKYWIFSVYLNVLRDNVLTVKLVLQS